MPTFRIRAKINGVVRRSWGESANEEEAREQATEQLSKITKDFEILTVEEIKAIESAAEQVVADILEIDRVEVPE